MTGSTAIPCLRYRDALAAIDWLCRAFGFTRQAVHADGEVVHQAQLVLSGGTGTGMVMLGSIQPGDYGRLMRQPDEAGGSTQSTYLYVADPDAVLASAKAAGARIAMDIVDHDYGGRGFTCIDPEGHVWSIGSYDPWQVSAAPKASGS